MEFVTDFTAYSLAATEENHQQFDQRLLISCSSKDSARPSKKKAKQKKVPQRGLGVAELERMRLEEQQKRGAGSSSLTDLTPPSSQYNPGLPIPSFNLYNIPSDPSVPPPVFFPLDGFKAQSMSSDSRRKWDEMWQKNLETERFTSDSMFAIGFSSYVEPVWQATSFSGAKPPPSDQLGLAQLPPMVNVSSTHSSPSGVNLQIEPPSNQIYLSNNSLAWPEDEKMVGMKRPLPCSFESSPASPAAFQWSNEVSPFAPYLSRYHESTCWPDMSKYDSGNKASRVQQDDIEPFHCAESNEALDGGFLTLRPPAQPEIPKSQQHFTWASRGLQGECHFYSSHGNVEGMAIQGNENVQTPSPAPPPWSVMQSKQPICYSFLPLGPLSNGDIQGERVESVDLSLKL